MKNELDMDARIGPGSFFQLLGAGLVAWLGLCFAFVL